MKIGALVQHYIPIIFEHCEKQDHSEFDRLCDRAYSKDTLDVNFPFCKPVADISALENRRYWSQIYVVRGKTVRVTNDWYDRCRPSVIRYLLRHDIEVIDADGEMPGSESITAPPVERPLRAARGRFKDYPIGNAQNLLIRNVLSNLGDESFGEEDWQQVIDAFGRRCAYCRLEGDLQREHVVPINKQSLGEHRLGNLVPSCKPCNASKGDKDFRAFLANYPDRIAQIEAHMERHDYVPISENEQIRQIIELAYKEVAQVAGRYIDIINTLMAGPPRAKGED
jgi:5-methylcytosine-specific restriction endonuclease McrA